MLTRQSLKLCFLIMQRIKIITESKICNNKRAGAKSGVNLSLTGNVKNKSVAIPGLINKLFYLSGRFFPRSIVMKVTEMLMSPQK